jgi:hypothetical protein
MNITENNTPFESGVGAARSALVSIPVLPDDRKELAIIIASASLGVGTVAATCFIDALLDNIAQSVNEPIDCFLDEAA